MTPEDIAARERFWKRFWLVVAILAFAILIVRLAPLMNVVHHAPPFHMTQS